MTEIDDELESQKQCNEVVFSTSDAIPTYVGHINHYEVAFSTSDAIPTYVGHVNQYPPLEDTDGMAFGIPLTL
ncbi:hypothetical protein SLEP1_g21069 [Rubroshorea leprosula]|uniref:Uncharacterized protein n=1 Tax=Rubroshorea leprosula TaxID=152421 RepID=A0AAV5JDZ4_9ROSI|nr:hypothetical protein SLEP1_g21069 [Rubroshorea leprosula]